MIYNKFSSAVTYYFLGDEINNGYVVAAVTVKVKVIVYEAV
jgi:hypothetical protein